jgi:hypothetical protein
MHAIRSSVDFTWRHGRLAPYCLFGATPKRPQSIGRLMGFDRETPNHKPATDQGTHAPPLRLGGPRKSQVIQRGFQLAPLRLRDAGVADIQGSRVTESAPSGNGLRIQSRRRKRIALQCERARTGGDAEFGVKEIEAELLSAGDTAGGEGFPPDEAGIPAK